MVLLLDLFRTPHGLGPGHHGLDLDLDLDLSSLDLPDLECFRTALEPDLVLNPDLMVLDPHVVVLNQNLTVMDPDLPFLDRTLTDLALVLLVLDHDLTVWVLNLMRLNQDLVVEVLILTGLGLLVLKLFLDLQAPLTVSVHHLKIHNN